MLFKILMYPGSYVPILCTWSHLKCVRKKLSRIILVTFFDFVYVFKCRVIIRVAEGGKRHVKKLCLIKKVQDLLLCISIYCFIVDFEHALGRMLPLMKNLMTVTIHSNRLS